LIRDAGLLSGIPGVLIHGAWMLAAMDRFASR
jgi:hypothetical protein